MKRKLLKQISNEWRSNLWLTVELLIVSVVMWYITDALYTKISILNEPKGFDTEHCYHINYAELTEKSSEYISNRSDEEYSSDMRTFVDRLEQRPEIECVAMGNNAYIYNGSNGAMDISHYTENDTIVSKLLYRRVSSDFPKVFRIHGANGETPEQLSELLKEPNTILLSDNAFEHDYGIETLKEYIGKEFIDNNYKNVPLVLRASYIPIRYTEFSSAEDLYRGRSMMRSMPQGNERYYNEIVVRVRENMDKDFIENLMNDADKHFRIGNLYIASVQSFDDKRAVYIKSDVMEMRKYFTGVAFLALNIFLGLLGTFWFRTQQRTSEIAIRKANGAHSGSIFRRLIGEGELLLLIVTPLAAIIDYLLVHFELNTYYHYTYFDPTRFLACILISWAFLALIILLGISIPANRAMKIAPAIALKDE